MEELYVVLFWVDHCSQVFAEVYSLGSGHVIFWDDVWVAGDGWDDDGGEVHAWAADFYWLRAVVDDDQLLNVNLGFDEFALVGRVVRATELWVVGHFLWF